MAGVVHQVWHHRRALVEQLDDASDELAFVQQALADDAKNYHAWSHRQWVVERFGLYDGELAFTEKVIDIDVRNNSGWSHRHFVVSRTTGFAEEHVWRREADFALDRILLAPNNESPWNYLRACLQTGKGDARSITHGAKRVIAYSAATGGRTEYGDWREHARALEVAETSVRDAQSIYAAVHLAEQAMADYFARDSTALGVRARHYYELLANTLDPVRSRYWQWCADQLPQ